MQELLCFFCFLFDTQPALREQATSAPKCSVFSEITISYCLGKRCFLVLFPMDIKITQVFSGQIVIFFWFVSQARKKRADDQNWKHGDAENTHLVQNSASRTAFKIWRLGQLGHCAASSLIVYKDYFGLANVLKVYRRKKHLEIMILSWITLAIPDPPRIILASHFKINCRSCLILDMGPS